MDRRSRTVALNTTVSLSLLLLRKIQGFYVIFVLPLTEWSKLSLLILNVAENYNEEIIPHTSIKPPDLE